MIFDLDMKFVRAQLRVQYEIYVKTSICHLRELRPAHVMIFDLHMNFVGAQLRVLYEIYVITSICHPRNIFM